MTLSWKSLATISQAAIEPPPVGSLISTYALDVDPDGRPLYYCEPDDDERGAELWAFDGKAWKKLHARRLPKLEELEGGGWDTVRSAFCVFGFDFDHQTRTWGVRSFAIGLDGKHRELKFTGEVPVTRDEEIEPGTFDMYAAFAFDHSRKVWVCFTRFGIWELDASGAWSKRRDRGDDAWPTDWSNETGQAFFDPLGKRTVFWLQESEEYEVQAWAWDGTSLSSIPMKGLPKLTHGLFDVSCQLGGHPTHGVLLQVEGQVFALEGSTWSPLPAKGNGPPRMEFGLTAFSPKHGWFLGPAKHYKSGNVFQRVFFVLKDGAWSTHGVVHTPSELAASGYGRAHMGHADGSWLATSTNSLRTWRREGTTKWAELIDDKAGQKIIGNEPLALVWDAMRLWAVNWKGAIAEWSGDAWKVLHKGDSAFKERRGFAAAFDGQGRLVVWGGEVKNRKQNDTLLLENGKWRAVKKASPQPADFKHGKDGTYVDFHLVFDSTLGRLVRFGFDEVAVLQDDETWAAVKVKNYTKSISSRAYGHVPAHDPETGETLLIDFENARVVRFDLAGCTEVTKFDWPAALLPKKQHDTAAHNLISESFSYDPKTKTVYAADLKESTSVFVLELAPAFEAAKKLGARKTMGAGPSKAASTSQKRIAYRVKGGKLESATAPKAGFVTAEALDVESLKAMVGVPAERISVAKKGAVTKSRVGGPAPAVAAKKWPKVGKAPMGFLFQLETGALLKKYAGVAVFCALDGEATTEEDQNAVVLLKAADLAKTAAQPDGVPQLPARPITFEATKVEIDEQRVVELGGKDAQLAQVLEKFGSSKVVQEPSAQKRGGVPQFLQGEMKMKGWKFIAQLDFDALDVSKSWPEAGLSGCVYVFVKDDEKDAFAIWQYT